MAPGEMVFSGNTKTGKPLIVRYLQESDLDSMLVYINKLSQERTFIRFQGEVISIEEEKKFVDHMIEGIQNRKAVMLVAICNGQLMGASQVSLGEKTEKHIGLFGLSVDQAYRGEGVGTILMQNVINEAKQNLMGLEIINLHVFSKNQVAIEMYKAMGFAEYGRLPNGHKLDKGHDDCVMMYLPTNT
jgi:ribosomal protein S18 acetylase RimI-like enzyme